MPLLIIISRWIHILSACIALGGLFFVRFLLPAGLAALDADHRQAVEAKLRRPLKMTLHVLTLLFLLTGAFNSYIAWPRYQQNPAFFHPLWGTHLLLGLVAMGLWLYWLAGRKNSGLSGRWILITIAVLLLGTLIAATLKWGRDRATASPRTPPVAVYQAIDRAAWAVVVATV